MASVVFIERIACFLLEVLQMCSYQHVPKREEIAVLQALDLGGKKNFGKKLIEDRRKKRRRVFAMIRIAIYHEQCHYFFPPLF